MAAAAAPQELRFLAPRPDDLDRRALLHLAFFFLIVEASAFTYLTGKPSSSSSSSVAAEDVLALFLFWLLCLLIFFVSFALDALPEEAARIVAGALRNYLSHRNRLLLFS